MLDEIDDVGSGSGMLPPPSLPPPSSPPPGLPPPMPSGLGRDFTSNMIGFGLVLLASTGICISLNMQKLVHMRNTDAQTGQAVVNFVTLPMWWAATLLNVVAEVFNLLALGYAPATLVTPLGCLTVVFNAIASRVLSASHSSGAMRSASWQSSSASFAPPGRRHASFKPSLRTTNPTRTPTSRFGTPLACEYISSPSRAMLSYPAESRVCPPTLEL